MDGRTAPGSAAVPDSKPTRCESPGNDFSRNEDRRVLLHLYRTTGGESWPCQDGWAENEDDLGGWFGVTANAEGRVVKLDLEGGTANGECTGSVVGIMPPGIGLLGALKVLILTKNHISGAIPREMGQLLGLEELDLSCNEMTGPIPKELGDLRVLKTLKLGGNKLSGMIPPELGQLESLEWLALTTNKLNGSIPPELGRLGALKILYFGHNNISGNVPPELGQLRALVALTAPGNRLTGSIPPEIGGLKALKALYLDRNRLSGSIPSELSELDALERLYLHGNELSGSIPKGLGGGKSSLVFAWFNSNKLTHFRDAKDGLRLVERLGPNLRLEDNPWIMPPEGVVENGIPAVRRFLQALRSAEEAGAQVKTLRLLKVVLVGSSQAGKTSLVKSMLQGHGSPTVGTPAEVSTVGIEIHRHTMEEGTVVEFYDCAGQVDYYGLHQTFLTRRALYLLVWDMSKCHGKHGEELDEVIRQDIMRWMYTLHLRAPGSTVILVANKCDGGIDHFVGTAATVETRARGMLKEWQHSRGIGGQVKPHKTGVAVLPEASLVTCVEGSPQACGLVTLIARVADQDKTSIMVPPAWGFALTFLDALRDGRAPLTAAREYLNLGPSPCPEVGREDRETQFMAEAALFQRWENIVKSVKGELRSKAENTAVSDPASAMEGALWISEFAGQIVRVANGGGIFLDVVWLAGVLKPILSHKLKDEVFSEGLAKMRDELVHDGVLRQEFAKCLWSRLMGAPPSEKVEDAMRGAILNLGVALPLDPASPSDSGRKDMLVIMRLDEVPGKDQQRDLESLMSDMMKKHGNQDLILKWRFDSAGPPHGLVERVIASCRLVGVVEMGMCWRYGAVFHSHALAQVGEPRRLYSFAIRYDDTIGTERRVLQVRMVGPLKDRKVWAALRWVASSVANLSRRWPGVLWEGWPECAKGHKNRMYFAAPDKALVGEPLLPPGEVDGACDCRRVQGGALRLVLERLGAVVDTETGKLPPSEASTPEESDMGSEPGRRRRAPAPNRNTSEYTPGLEDVVAESEEEEPAWYNEAFSLWEPFAGRTAKGLYALALVILTTGAAVRETDGTGWNVCLGLMGLSFLAAGVATAFSFCYHRREARAERERQRDEADTV